MNYFKKFRPLILLVGVFAICYSVVLYSSAAWTDAPGVPSDCPAGYPGCDAPINAGPTAQTKIGGLTIGTEAVRNDLRVNGVSWLSTTNVYGNLTITSPNSLCFGTDCKYSWGQISPWTPNGDDISNVNSGNIGIGTTNPASPLHILSTKASPPYDMLTLQVIGDTLNYKRLDFRRARGTESAPSAVSAGDTIGIVNFQSYRDGFAWGGAASIQVDVPTPTANGWGGDMIFYTSPSGSSGSIPRMKIMNSGNVGIGGVIPTSILHIDKSSVTTTITVGGSGGIRGACLKLRDDNNGGWTYCTTRAGVMTCGITSCE